MGKAMKRRAALLLAVLLLFAHCAALAVEDFDADLFDEDDTDFDAAPEGESAGEEPLYPPEAFAGKRPLSRLFPDNALRKLVAGALKVKPSAQVTANELSTIYELDYSGKGKSEKIRSLAGLEYLVRLEEIYLDNNLIEDIAPMERLNVYAVDLSNNLVRDLSPLKGAADLVALSVANNRVSDLSPLSQCSLLRMLLIEGNPISSLAGIKDLNRLTHLSFGSYEMRDISAIRYLGNLRELIFSGHQIEDISALGYLSQLEKLTFTANAVRDISALGKLNSLSLLDIGGILIEDISPLASLTQLLSLSINTTSVYDITPLQHLKRLWELDLSCNRIVSPTPIANLKQLEYLSLRENYIEDVRSLCNLTPELMDLRHNRIADISPLFDQDALPYAELLYADEQSIVLGGISSAGQREISLPIHLVDDNHPYSLRTISAKGGTVSGNTVTWKIKPGEKKVLSYDFSSTDNYYYQFSGTVFQPIGGAKSGGYQSVTFDTNDGNCVQTGQRALSGGRIKKPADPTRPAYRFAGWNTQPDGKGKTWNFARDAMPAQHILLYAIWK